ncbi:MAG: hypothetical protein IJ736_01975, partial [Firmicutes bacterium]|nr:hypothetical protein [Bacillota bacterium]
FDAANDVLKGRNELIPAEDAFYGKLSKLNDELYRVTCTAIKNTVQFDRELEEASLDLFEELWNAREKNDFIKKTVDITRVIVNTAATSAAVGVTLKAGISSLLAGAALAAPGIGFLLPSLAAIVSVGAIVNIVGSVIENKSGENMEAAARKAIDEFNTRLDEIKSDTIEQTTGYLLETFDR